MTTRQRLSIEAARLFAKRGYHGTSIGDLADALGIRKSSVYSHINGKEDLLAEIALAGAAAFHEALDGLPAATSPVERLRLALGAHLMVVDRQLDVATVWLQEWRYLPEASRGAFLAERRRYEQRIRDLLQGAVDDGSLRDDLDVHRAMLVFFSVANWSYTWMTHDTHAAAEGDALWFLLQSGFEPR